MSHKLQKIGSILWIISIILLFIATEAIPISAEMGGGVALVVPAAWLIYSLLIATFIIDLVLIKKKEPTITQWYRKKLPKTVDTIITIAVVGLFIWYHTPLIGLYILQGTIHGHLNGDW